ncbi:MAG: zinc-binding alcohol dehydrogenase family protein [Treponema sp.]|nr:zinc-binding alcohol dehydrogenase family protein [Treponema sp.]
MKALYIVEPLKMEMRELPVPVIQAPDEVLVKVMMAGICGSDMHNYLGESSGIAYPLVAGHEMAALVLETGSGARGLEAGDHVVLDPVISCGYCYPCSIGRGNVCENLKARGSHYDGCMQEFMVLKRRTIHKISRDLPWEKAALVEPFTIAGQSTSRAAVSAGDTVYIGGAGPIGLCILLMCKLLGAEVIISDIIAPRLELAARLGADHVIDLNTEEPSAAIKKMPGVHGITAAFDAVGHPAVFAQLVKLALPAARILCMGFSPEPSPVSLVDITKKELTILGSRMSVNQFDRIIKLTEEGRLDGTPLVSGVFDFKDGLRAFQELKENKAAHCKVLIRINAEDD